MAAKVCDESNELYGGKPHAWPVYQVTLLAQQTSRGKGQRKIFRKAVGHYCLFCLLSREFTVKGHDLRPGRARGA